MNRSIVGLVQLSVALVFLAGCGDRTGQDVQGEVPSFASTLNSQDPQKMAEWFTDDGAVLPENLRRVDGKQNILQYYTDLAAADLAYEVESTGTIGDRTLAVNEGTYRVLNVKTNQEVEKGKYIAVLKKLDNGWRVYRLINNTDVPPPGTSVTVGDSIGDSTVK